MPFDPISWLASFTLGRFGGRLLQTPKDKRLTKELRQAVKNWAKNSQPPVLSETLETIFSPDIDESKPELYASRNQLSETILDKRLPSTDEIHAALLESWDGVRAERPPEDLVRFFQLSRKDVANKFEGLAIEIRNVLGRDTDIFRDAVLGLLEGRDGKSAGPRPPDDSPVFTVPYPRHNCFKGRDDILADLRRSFVEGKQAALTQAISGLGGIGKTQTAVEYAHKHREDYKAILWVKAETELDISESMASAAKLLELAGDESKTDDAVRALMHWLQQSSDWLLIFDNADNPKLLKPFIPPTSTGHILLTSRASVFDALGILNPIELPLLSVEHAVEFLLERTGHSECDENETESARELAEELGLLPLALEQAGAYIYEMRLGFAAYLDRYRKRRLEFLERGQPAMDDYPESVATTWAVNFEEVESKSEVSAALLRLTSFLGPDNIPFEAILLGGHETSCSLAEAISKSNDPELLIREALQPLTRFSLVTINGENATYSIHRLVQEAVKHSLDDSSRGTWAERAVDMLNEAFPEVEFENWNLCRRLLAHAVTASAEAEALAIRTIAISDLENEAACFLCEQAQFAEGEPLIKRALETTLAVVGQEHPHYASSLINLAEFYRAAARYSEAEKLLLEALEICRTALGEEHALFATCLNNLAGLYRETRQDAEAEPLYEQALEVNRTALGEQHPHFATGLGNLALLYEAVSRYAEAEQLYEQALEIRRTALGEQHPDFATSLNNLAVLYCHMDRYEEAEPLLDQALEIRRTALGEQHPDFVSTLTSLAVLYRKTGRDAEADELANKRT